MAGRLAGKVAVVSGGARGMGASVVDGGCTAGLGHNPTWLTLVRTAVRVWLSASIFTVPLLRGSRDEFLFAPTRLNFDTGLVMTAGSDPASWLSVVVGAGRVHSTTSRRVRRWALGTAGQRAGEGWADARAILH